jgi:flagellar motility protein MotE (MotC chaperone)
MKLLRNPVVLILLGLLSGLGAGLGWFWRAADSVSAKILARHAAEAEARKPAAPWGFWTIEIENLASELKGERALLKQQADQLAQREARFAAERQELDKVRTEIEGLRREIAAKVVEIQADEAKNLRTLAQTYTSTTPRATVAIFREMDDVTVVKILSLMKSESVAPIFEEMSRAAASDAPLARRAAVLSEKLRVVRSARSPGGP